MMSGVMPNCSWQKKVPDRPMPGLHLVEDHERLVPAAERLRLLPELVGREVDALALDRLGDERRHVAPAELTGQGGWASPKGIMSQPGSSGPKPLRNSCPPLRASAPVVSPWKAWSQ